MRDEKLIETRAGIVFQMTDRDGVVRKLHYSPGQLHYSSEFKRRALVKNVSLEDAATLIPLLEMLHKAHKAADMYSAVGVGATGARLRAVMLHFPRPKGLERKVQKAPFYGMRRFLGLFCTPKFAERELDAHVADSGAEYASLLKQGRMIGAEVFRFSMYTRMVWLVSGHALVRLVRGLIGLR